MVTKASIMKTTELNPKQPEFVLGTSNYVKKHVMKYNISHFYQFTAEADKIGVIPDACIDILFKMNENNIISIIAGSRFEKGDVSTDIGCVYFGVRFYPGMNPVNKHIKISELMNNEESFSDLIDSLEVKERLLDEMFLAKSFEDRISIFLAYYLNSYNKSLEPINNLTSFLRNKISNTNGDLKLRQLSNITGYSERYLNKKIHDDFGLNPKCLIQFIRFQKSVSNLIQTIHHINSMDTALETGYYDQSHFIRDFRKYSGLTPTKYISNLLRNSYDKKLHVL